MNDRTVSGDHFAKETEPWLNLAVGAVLLRGFALATERELMSALETVVAAAPFRHMVTPGGQAMSVAMTNCGSAGWVTDNKGYRYDRIDPLTGRPWPQIPRSFLTLARDAAARAGYPGFEPDACLINRYVPGTRLTLHQGKDQRDFSAPIVSVSLGLPAKFLFGGACAQRTSTARDAATCRCGRLGRTLAHTTPERTSPATCAGFAFS
jgi:alkylated DNA repair protein (DNA oxidative demethylase)